MGTGPKNIICIALLDTGEKLQYDSAFKTKQGGIEYLSHLKNVRYLGEGIEYSFDGVKIDGGERLHFFNFK